ncbi:MAG: lipid-binding protein [Saprospiraceae bacterium]
MNFKIIFLLLVVGFAFQSCDLGTEPDIGGTNTRKMAGEWYLQLFDADDNALTNHSLFTTSNTAANLSTEMWLIDNDVFAAQTKLSTNQDALTFTQAGPGDNLLYEGDGDAPDPSNVVDLGSTEEVQSATYRSMTITDGRILANAAHPPSNTVTDSLVMTITGNIVTDTYTAISYSIVDNGGVLDTSVVWQKVSSALTADGPYLLKGYRRTGFLEDEH